MKRERRLQPLHDLAGYSERDLAVRLAGIEQRLLAAEQRHEELLRYRLEYDQAFHASASGGAPMRGLREQQVFIARLGEAVRAQQALLEQLRLDSARARAQWRAAATRRPVVGKVIAQARSEESMRQEKRQQREMDELANQPRVRR